MGFPVFRACEYRKNIQRCLLRVDVVNNQLFEQETLFKGIGRIQDFEERVNGTIYEPVEHDAGGQILKLVLIV